MAQKLSFSIAPIRVLIAHMQLPLQLAKLEDLVAGARVTRFLLRGELNVLRNC